MKNSGKRVVSAYVAGAMTVETDALALLDEHPEARRIRSRRLNEGVATLIVDATENKAVGLLFAGSNLATIFTPIDAVLTELNITI